MWRRGLLYSEEDSFLNTVNANCGPVLTRFTCCTYYALTGQIQKYCEEFINLGDGLVSFCENSGYGSSQRLSITHNEEYNLLHSYKYPHSHGNRILSIQTPGKEFVFVHNPVKMKIDLTILKNSIDFVITIPIKNVIGSNNSTPGFYKSENVYGDHRTLDSIIQPKGEEGIDMVLVELLDETSSKVLSTRYFSYYSTLVVPPLPNELVDIDSKFDRGKGHFSRGFLHKVAKDYIEFVMEAFEASNVSVMNVRNVKIG